MTNGCSRQWVADLLHPLQWELHGTGAPITSVEGVVTLLLCTMSVQCQDPVSGLRNVPSCFVSFPFPSSPAVVANQR